MARAHGQEKPPRRSPISTAISAANPATHIPILRSSRPNRAFASRSRRMNAVEIQTLSCELTPALMWGQFTRPAGYRTTLKDFIGSSYPIFCQVEKAQPAWRAGRRNRQGGGCPSPCQPAQ